MNSSSECIFSFIILIVSSTQILLTKGLMVSPAGFLTYLRSHFSTVQSNDPLNSSCSFRGFSFKPLQMFVCARRDFFKVTVGRVITDLSLVGLIRMSRALISPRNVELVSKIFIKNYKCAKFKT